MRKMVLILLAFVLLGFINVSVQGVDFEYITFQQALKKAKAENKLVFIDFYTVWCEPCKKIAKEVFPDPEIGALYNKNFVSLKLDA